MPLIQPGSNVVNKSRNESMVLVRAPLASFPSQGEAVRIPLSHL